MGSRRKWQQWTEADARAHLAAWVRSGQSGAAYARSVGIVAERLFWWRRRFARRAAEAHVGGDLVPVMVRGVADPSNEAIVVTTASGVRIEVKTVSVATAAWVASVVREAGA